MIFYTTVTRKVLAGKCQGQDKKYAVAKQAYKLSLRGVAERVSCMSSLSEADVFAVVEAVRKVIRWELEHGGGVTLNGIGTFSLSLQTEGIDPEERFTKKHIKDIKINFLPSKEFRLDIDNLEFRENPSKYIEIVTP